MIGDIKKVKHKGRIVMLKQVKESGFGMYKIISNSPQRGDSRLSKVV